MYKDQQQAPAQPGDEAKTGDGGKQDESEVVDAEYEEVKDKK